MTKLYRIEVGERVDRRGVSTWMSTGLAVRVQGDDMVRMSHGTIVARSPDWAESESDANLRAAMKIEAMGRRLLDQAEELRAKAQPKEVAT